MKGLPLKLKGRLYSAFVHSVLLYNSEVWTITETEMKALVGRNGYLMRRLVGEVVRSADDKRLTESQLLEMLGLESIQSLIRKRKLQWVAHCARRGEEDLSWKRIVREVEDGKSKWGTRLKEDWKELGVKSTRGWCNRSRIKDGWHTNWERARRKEKGRRRRTKIRDNTVVEFHNHHGLCGRRAAEREFVKIAGSTHGEGEDVCIGVAGPVCNA